MAEEQQERAAAERPVGPGDRTAQKRNKHLCYQSNHLCETCGLTHHGKDPATGSKNQQKYTTMYFFGRRLHFRSYRNIDSKVIKSNRHPNPTMPAKPCPEVPHPHLF